MAQNLYGLQIVTVTHNLYIFYLENDANVLLESLIYYFVRTLTQST